MNFASDNTAPILPEVMAAIEAINRGRAASYGADAETERLQALACEVFETDLAIFPVATGTAANGLALATGGPLGLLPQRCRARLGPQGHLCRHDAFHGSSARRAGPRPSLSPTGPLAALCPVRLNACGQQALDSDRPGAP